MVEQLSITLLDYSEMETVAQRILSAVKEEGTINEAVSVAVKLIEADILYLQSAQRKSLTSRFTGLISEKDYERDSLFRRVKNYLALYKEDDPEISKAAHYLIGVIRNRGWKLNEENYEQQSALLSQLFIDLSTGEAEKAIALTGAGVWLDRLKKCELEFKELISERNDEEAARETALLSEAERNISRHLTTLFRMLEMFEEADPDRYGGLNAKISAINVDMRTKARGRKTREEGAF